MTPITFKVSNNVPSSLKDSLQVFSVGTDDKGLILIGAGAKFSALKGVDLKALQVSGKYEAIGRVNTKAGVIGLVGVGGGITSQSKAREIGGSIGRAFNDVKTIVVDIPLPKREMVVALIEGIAIVQYEYNKYKSEAKSSLVLKLSLIHI